MGEHLVYTQKVTGSSPVERTIRKRHVFPIRKQVAFFRFNPGKDGPRVRWGIITGFIADRIIGDPQHHHPVAYFGKYASFLERHLYRDSKAAGVAFTVAAVIPPTLVAACAPAVFLPVAVWASLGGTTLENVGKQVAADLDRDDVEHARTWVPWLCSRDPEYLDGDGIARATVESLAENTSDAAVAPLVWAGLAGAPGVVLHRVANTLDAMVGYTNERYTNFGWASARLDDILGFIPARVTTAIHLLFAPKKKEVWQRVYAAAKNHPSPNAGWVEASAAEALGVTLGGRTVYPYGVEERPRLGHGPQPGIATVKKAVRLSLITQLASLAVGALIAQKRSSRRASNLA